MGALFSAVNGIPVSSAGIESGGTAESPIIIDGDGMMFEVRKDGDAGDIFAVDTVDSQIIVPDGSNSLPSLRGTTTNSGVYFAGGVVQFTILGIRRAFIDSNRLSVDAGQITFGSALDTQLLRDAAATLQMGLDAASPIAQTFKAHDGSGTDIIGADLIVAPGNGTGNALSGQFRVQSAPAGSTGASQNTPVDRLIVDSVGDVQIVSGYLAVPADKTTDVAPTDDTSAKKLSIQRLSADPTNAAFIKFSNSPGTPTNDFYLVLEEA